MVESGEFPYFLRELFPDAGAALARLLQSAAENAYLSRTDFYTMRDWLELADRTDDEALSAILILMLTALEEGSLCIEISAPSLGGRLADLASDADAKEWTRRILAALDGRGFPELIGASLRDARPIVVQEFAGLRHLYFQKYLRAELDFRRELEARLANKPEELTAEWANILNEVLHRDPLRIAHRPLELDRDQKLALGVSLCSPFAIISGGPGTGKTSIVLTLLRCLMRGGVSPERIAIAAPTGRAAQRLTDSLRVGLSRLESPADAPLADLAASTLHQLLGYRPTRNLFTRHRENPIPADVVIIDEVSMVGLVLMSQLLDALDSGTRLILLGDKDQLPSVEAGAVLAQLVPDGQDNGFSDDHAERLAKMFPDLNVPRNARARALQDHVVLLKTNHRSEPRIREAAQAINAQDDGVVDRLPRVTGLDTLESQGGCWLLEQVQQSGNEIRAVVQKWADYSYAHSRHNGATLAELLGAASTDDAIKMPERVRDLFTLLDRFRLLTLVRDGAWGCVEINRTIDQYLRPRLDPQACGRLFVGAPVLITRNDAPRGLFNGDVGITLRNRKGGLDVLFQRQGGCAAFPAEALPAHELGFALTVHKSQGSEYANVMVVLSPTGGRRLLTKELIYTAITRAKSLAVICAAKDVLKFAIRRKIVRESGVFRHDP